VTLPRNYYGLNNISYFLVILKKQRDEGLINEDTAEKYEDSPNGVEVRDERSETNKVDKSDDMQDDPEMLLNEDMNLDELDPDDESGKQENDDEIDQSDLHDEYNPDIDASMDHQEEEVNDDVENPDIAQAFGDGGVANIEEPPEEDEESSGEADSVDLTDAKNKSNEVELGIKQKNFGVKSMNGIDAINQEEDEKSVEITENGDGAESISGQDKQEALRGSSRGGTNDTTGNISHGETDNAINEKSHGKPQLDHPNPFRSPGDAEKFWHNRLEMIDDKVYDEDVEESQNAKSTDNYGDVEEQQHEFSRRGEDSTTQVLGATMDEFATDLDLDKNDEEVENKVLQEQKDNVEDEELNEIRNDKKATSYPENKQKEKSKAATDTVNENNKVSENIPLVEGEVTDDDSNCNAELDAMSDCLPAEEADDVGVENQEPEVKNKVVLDLAQLRLQQDEGEDKSEIVSRYDLMEAYCHPLGGLTTEMVMKGRSTWVNLNFETLPISRRLCEKLRLVMEPLVAAKLRGDYRSGKRINMKRIIGYIASGYRKDKIWLRRTKPSKRDYRVLLAVDNSESMAKTGAGGMALLALAALANGMSQLEVGELGVASFGETMRLLHPFSAPFTVESGANIACNLGFDEKRTRTALCVENVITALEEAGGGLHSSLQLVFIISDGRIERDSRSKLRRLVREMSERNMLCVMIIVEGTHDSSSATVKRHSIMDMKEATFSNGIPKLVHFIDDYPFPYYMVLEDMTSLPEVLGDALRQWFEILAQIAT
jgi:midasin